MTRKADPRRHNSRPVNFWTRVLILLIAFIVGYGLMTIIQNQYLS